MAITANIGIKQLRRAARVLKVLANPDRLLLLCQMTQGEYCVGEREETTGIRRPTLPQQLTVLRDEDMVATRRRAGRSATASPARKHWR